jgi:O-antigen/teichoic acid export membrane protein
MRKRIFSTFPTSTFFKTIIILASGTAIGQGVSFIFLIILQRWFYTPDDFGILGLFVSLSTLLAACSTLKLEYGIVIPKDDKKAITLVHLSFISVIAVSAISVLILFLLKKNLTQLNDSHFNTFLVLIPLVVLFSGVYEILIYWNNRKQNFKQMSKSKIVQSLSMETSRMGIALIKVDFKGLIIGRVIGQFASLVYLLRPFMREQWSLIKVFSLKDLRITLNEFRDFPLFTMPTVFISNFSHLLLLVLFFQFYGSNNAGLVSVALQYIALPFGIIASAFSQAFFQKISTYDTKKELLSLYIKLAKKLGVIALIVTLAVYAVPNSIVVMIIGPEWSGLTEFIKLSILWQAIAFVASSLSFIYTRLLRQKVMALFGLLQLGIVYFSLTFSNHQYNDTYISFLFYVIGQCIYYSLAILAAIYFIKKSKVIS